jgi:hypothetical protein
MTPTLHPLAVSAAQHAADDDWVGELDTNAYGVRLLTLRKAFELASAGCCAGWYISPYAVKWTVGRMAKTGQRYHVIADGEPMRFETVGEAFQFLGGILRLAAAPQLALDFPALTLAASASRRTSPL